MSKYLYRIEHKDTGYGVYNHRNTTDSGERYDYSSIFEMAMDFNIELTGVYHKSPHHDGLAHVMQEDSRYGCRSVRLIGKWFSTNKDFYAHLEGLGFQFVRYQVGERFDSKCQSVAMLHSLSKRTVLPFSKIYQKNLA